MSTQAPVVFRCAMPNVGFVFRDGTRVVFKGTRMVLTNFDYIREMREAVAAIGNITFSEDKEDKGFDVEDPIEAIRSKIIKEYEASKLASVDQKEQKVETKPVESGVKVNIVK